MVGACLEDMQGFYVPCNASSQNAVSAYPASSTRKTLVCCGKQYVLVLAAVQMKKSCLPPSGLSFRAFGKNATNLEMHELNGCHHES